MRSYRNQLLKCNHQTQTQILLIYFIINQLANYVFINPNVLEQFCVIYLCMKDHVWLRVVTVSRSELPLSDVS